MASVATRVRRHPVIVSVQIPPGLDRRPRREAVASILRSALYRAKYYGQEFASRTRRSTAKPVSPRITKEMLPDGSTRYTATATLRVTDPVRPRKRRVPAPL